MVLPYSGMTRQIEEHVVMI